MSFNLDAKAMRLDGSSILWGSRNDAAVLEEVTWKRLVVDAINGPYDGDNQLSLSEKSLLGRLAKIVQRGGDITLKSENVSKIKERLSKGLIPEMVQQLCEILDPAEAAKWDEGL